MPGVLTLAAGARFENYGTLAIGTNVGIAGDATTRTDNYGAVVVDSGPSAVAAIDTPFNNYGSVAVQRGVFRLGYGGNPFTGYAGSSVAGAAGTVVDFEGPATFFPSSDLTADTLVFDPASTLNLPIGGRSAGTGYANIRAATEVDLGGQFQINVLDGYAPHLGDTLKVIDNQSSIPVSGSFSVCRTGPSSLPEAASSESATRAVTVTTWP